MNAPLSRPSGALRVQAQALRAQADVLETLADAIEATPAPAARAEMLDLEGLRAEFKLGRGAVLAAVRRGELDGVVRGSRGRILVPRSSVASWLESRPVVVAERSSPGEVVPLARKLDDWDALADAELSSLPKASKGSRR